MTAEKRDARTDDTRIVPSGAARRVGAADDDERFMRAALAEAALARDADEAPVGAVIVRGGEIIARAHNLRESAKSPCAHAELLAIEAAARAVGGWRLAGCTLYVTLEPCPMCAGAIVNARVPRVVYGAKDPKAGALGSVLDLRTYPLNHKPSVTSGVLAGECAALLRDYFTLKRGKKAPDGGEQP
jgi:tRNA(adenine34) deaminase